jgi:hypothetical protein
MWRAPAAAAAREAIIAQKRSAAHARECKKCWLPHRLPGRAAVYSGPLAACGVPIGRRRWHADRCTGPAEEGNMVNSERGEASSSSTAVVAIVVLVLVGVFGFFFMFGRGGGKSVLPNEVDININRPAPAPQSQMQ